MNVPKLGHGINIVMAEAKVPCGNCTACCQGPDRTGARLDPQLGDRLDDYQWEIRVGAGFWLLQKDNGDCIYLDPGKGCTIYNRRPAMCRWYDCRVALAYEPERIKLAAEAAMQRGKSNG